MENKVLLQCLSGSRWVTELVRTFHDERFMYQVFRYCGGGSLANLLQHWSLSSMQQRAIAAELVVLVDDAHRHGCALRNLSAQSILIDESGHLRYNVSQGVVASGTPSVDRVASVAAHASSAPGEASPPPSARKFSVMLQDSGETRSVALKRDGTTLDALKALQWKLRLPATEPLQLRFCDSGLPWTVLQAADNPLVIQAEHPGAKFELRKDPDGKGTPEGGAKSSPAQPATREQRLDWAAVGNVIFTMVAGTTWDGLVPLKLPGGASPELADLLMRLLVASTNRLGCRSGRQEFENHPYFRGFDWSCTNELPELTPLLDSDVDFSYFEDAAPVRGLRLNDPGDDSALEDTVPVPEGWDSCGD